MFKNFTRRNNLDVPDCELQYENIPKVFRLDIYQAVKEKCGSTIAEYSLYRDSAISIKKTNIRFDDADEIDQYYNPDYFAKLIEECEWHEMLSMIEHFINLGVLSPREVDELFEYHHIGYRTEPLEIFSDKVKIVVHYDSLIKETQKVLDSGIKYKGVLASIKAAKRNLNDPDNISLAQSIKQSIDAVEGYLKGWLKEKGIKASTLGDALKELEKNKLCPQHIIKSLQQFYIYRNMTDNIGHGSTEVAPIQNHDALLCLDMSVSFINYFYRKSK